MNPEGVQGEEIGSILPKVRFQRGLAFGVIIITALLAFEIFNYSTTDYALTDLLGNLTFLGVKWSTILAIAFCGIDFAGIARLFTPEEGKDEPGEVWYLFGAWLLAATMNAMLTWWGVSLAILNNQTVGSAVIERATLLRAVPIFVAVLVWLIRVLIIGTFSVAGDRMFTQDDTRAHSARPRPFQAPAANVPVLPTRTLGARTPTPRPAVTSGGAFRPAPKPAAPSEPSYSPRPEPSYIPTASMSGANNKSATEGPRSPRTIPPTRR